jgi:hypothetical protein
VKERISGRELERYKVRMGRRWSGRGERHRK